FRPVMAESACAVLARQRTYWYEDACLNSPAGHAVAVHNAYGLSARREPALRRQDNRRSKMRKIKTKSSVKKRFNLTATGKVKVTAAGKRQGMIKRTTKFISDARGTMVLSDQDAKIVKKFTPYGL